MNRLVLLGSNGLLGSAFQRRLTSAPHKKHSLFVFNRETVDPGNPTKLREALSSCKPQVVVNCIAHTNVEAAEDYPEVANEINATFPALLADSCKNLGALLVHFSSTGCYGAWKDTPYDDEDALHPTTAHHVSKVAGENGILRSGVKHLILRTGWLYGGPPGHPKNFVWKRLIEALGKPELISDASQRGCPTNASDLVTQVLALLEEKVVGTYNASATGSASRFEYVSEIILASGLPCIVRAGPAFVRKAKVSNNEMATNHRLDVLGVNLMPDWKLSLATYVRSLIDTSQWRGVRGSPVRS